MTRVGLADTWISYSPHLLPRASGLGPWLTETGIGSANCNLVSLHVSFIIHCSSSKGGWEKKTNMIAELLIPKKGLNCKEFSNCISAVVEGRAWGWCSNWVFICQGATCIFILRRSPPFSAPDTRFKWLFNTIQRHFCAKVQMERSRTTTAQHTRQGSTPRLKNGVCLLMPWLCRAQLMNKLWLWWWGIRNATTGIWLNAQFISQGAKFCP